MPLAAQRARHEEVHHPVGGVVDPAPGRVLGRRVDLPQVAEAARRMEKDARTLRRWARQQRIDLKRMRPGGKE
jgi:hypothetical protein